jgi:diguanylate cyclase (GGDEF)-like protein
MATDSIPPDAAPLVLIADDAPDQLQALTSILSGLEWRLSTAGSGEETLIAIMRDAPDLVLLDVIMPGMDGFEVLRNLRERPETKELPVIILTAKGEAEDVVAGLDAGASDYIAKPCSAAELQARVRTHLNFKRMRDHHTALITELQDALAAVKHLSGMIPICSHCKKIRNDLGYWQQVEEYIGGRTEAMFTHGLCPDCVPIFFPEMVQEQGIITQEPPPPAEDMESVLPRILVVDDSPLNLRMLIQFLRLDYKILVATSGPVALELARKEKPDLILLDVIMPEMDGRDVCRALKLDPRTNHIPIIFVTARGDEIDEMEGFELGAVDYITKPFSLPLVHARVKTHLELKHYRDVLALQVMQDQLTGLQNRKGFMEFLSLMWKQSVRERLTIALALFDIDHMKAFNQRYGRKAGDECIKRVAAAMRGMKRRNTDLLARYGGQEFACIMPGTDLEGAVFLADLIRKNIESLDIPHAASEVAPHVTISGGVVACRPMLGNDPSFIIEGASQALHRARRDGRNRVSS